jgi:hypothetical protein
VLDTDSGIALDGQPIAPDEALTAFADATKPDEPEIEEPRDGHVTLMWGIEFEGVRYRTAQVRELNGADEEALAKLPNDAWNFGILETDTVLRRAVENIGPVSVIDRPDVLSELLVGDRDILFKEILLATAGSVQEYENIVCVECGFEHDITVDFDDLLITPTMPADVDPTKLTVTLRDGTEVLYRWPTGKDQSAVFQGPTAPTQPEVNSAMLARIVRLVGGKVEPDPLDWVRKLGKGDRQILVRAVSQQPAVRFKEVEVPCEQCGKRLPTNLGWASLLQS